jgi:pimeloyl-ACP methyl ester carboxylesterase
MTDTDQTGRLDRGDGEYIAYRVTKPAKPAGPTGLTWLGGFKSDMGGTKVTALADWAARERRALLRFDYFGHGQSSGRFINGTIGRWRDDALAAFDALSEGGQVLVGSSMGGWIALLLALARPDRVKALVLIAPAPDFTEALMWAGFSDAAKEALMRDGVYREPSSAGEEDYDISRALIEEGRNHLLLDGAIDLRIPVRVLQGMRDESVPWQHAMRMVERLTSEDVEVHLSKAGDHRLSGADDLARLMRTMGEVLGRVE